jgi:SPP1 gp7 family putative phage head morphogenesis protein
MKFTDKQIDNLFKSIYEGLITVDNLPEDLYFAIANYVKRGLYEGFGGTLADFEFGGTDYELLNELRTNTYLFSGAKTYQQVREFSSFVGDSKTFKDFYEQAQKTYEQYNVDWAKAEYNTAIGQAQSAKAWAGFEENKELFPLLRYSAVMDANTSDICRPLDGIIRPVDDPFWNVHAPLNHFNCRCLLEKIDKYEGAKQSSDARIKQAAKEMDGKMDDTFKMNPGKDGYIFSPAHPYFEVAKGDKALARNNFNLPIPKND